MSNIWTVKTFENVTFVWYYGYLISVEYKDEDETTCYRTTFDNTTGKFVNTTVQQNNISCEYYHVSGNEHAGLFSVTDSNVCVTETETRVLNCELKQEQYISKSRRYRSMIKMQLSTCVPEWVLKVVDKNKIFLST